MEKKKKKKKKKWKQTPGIHSPKSTMPQKRHSYCLLRKNKEKKRRKKKEEEVKGTEIPIISRIPLFRRRGGVSR